MKIRDLLVRMYSMTIVSSILCFVLGFLSFWGPELAIRIVGITFGIVFIVLGTVIIINYLSDGRFKYVYNYSLIYGLLNLLFGCSMIINHKLIYILISLFVSINLLVSFINKVQLGLLFKNNGLDGWHSHFIIALALLMCGIIIMIKPLEGVITITKASSIIIMISSLLDLVDCLIIWEKTKKMNKIIKDIID